MKNILVTGAKGFIGKNLIVRLKESDFYQVLEYDKDNSLSELEDFITKAELIVHLAGSNRPVEISEYREVNFGLTEIITKLLRKYNLKTPIIFSSSTQAEQDNPYGIGKKQAEDLLFEFSRENKSKVFILRLTNVFGKWCMPDYNSAAATFCYNIAHNKEIQINDPERVLKLVYVDDVVNQIIKLVNTDPVIDCKPLEVQPIYEIKLGRLAELIYSFKRSRDDLVLPDVSDEFTKKMYSTYLSYLDKNDFKYELRTNSDDRGNLTELIKSDKFGQLFISTTKPGITRGNHYHNTKTEKFIVIKGKAEICFRKIDEGEIIKYEVCGDNIEVVDIPPGYTHSIKNTGEGELITLFWASEVFDPDKTDTYYRDVEDKR